MCLFSCPQRVGRTKHPNLRCARVYRFRYPVTKQSVMSSGSQNALSGALAALIDRGEPGGGVVFADNREGEGSNHPITRPMAEGDTFQTRSLSDGRTFEVLVEGESEETPLLWEGRTQYHAPEIDGTVYLNDFGPYEALTPGKFYRCEVTEAHDYDLVARVTGAAACSTEAEAEATGVMA